ncbi:MAG: ATP-NAD kinase [Nitrospiraceae bacterium]|nr:ATP-NAD kinase [Nitrospiraceae bacterium]
MKAGIIVNPQSGKDIRRIVSDAFTVNNFEKLNIVKRIVRAALSISDIEFVFMPDSFGFGNYLKEEFPDNISVIDFETNGESDTVKATKIMNKMGVCCIVVLGGDGTNRLVAKASGETPIVPVSTGTNNAFPYFYEGTIVGTALSAFANDSKIAKNCISREKRIEILRDSKPYDIALVDVAVIENDFVGSKAIWNITNIKKVFISFGEPQNTGLSSIFGFSMPVFRKEDAGAFCKIGKGEHSVIAPIMPGKLFKIPIESMEKVEFYKEVPIEYKHAVLALDGERNIYMNNGKFSIRITRKGPVVIDIKKVMELSVLNKNFILSRAVAE